MNNFNLNLKFDINLLMRLIIILKKKNLIFGYLLISYYSPKI